MAELDFVTLVGPHMTYLHDNLDLGWRLVNALCDVGLLTWDNRGDVMDQREPRTRRINRLLTEILPYTGPDAGDKFIEALQIAQQLHVVKKLREPIYREEAARFAQTHHRAGMHTGLPGRAGLQGQALNGWEAQNQPRQTQAPETDEFLQRQLDDDTIFFIGQHIGRWKSLGRCLGFTEGQMENIEEDYFKNQEEQGIQMLHKWVRREGANATVAKLVAAAQKAQKGDVAHLVQQYAKKQT